MISPVRFFVDGRGRGGTCQTGISWHIRFMTISTPSHEAELLRRVVDPQRAGWSREAAEAILALSFPSSDQERASELAQKAGADTLTAEEQREMEDYKHVGRLIELMQSRARLSLKNLRSA